MGFLERDIQDHRRLYVFFFFFPSKKECILRSWLVFLLRA